MLDEALPWHDTLWQRLRQLHRKGTLPHALLLTGPEGVGKRSFARQLAGWLLCENSATGDERCGQCAGCHLYQAGHHPDLLWVTREASSGKAEFSREIKVSQVRDTISWLSLTAHGNGLKIVVVEPAETLNWNAANALLKSLEEPPAGTLLVLVSSRPGQLPATIRSRCQQLRFAVPELAQGLGWLQPRLDAGQDANALLAQAGGAPLRALSILDDPMQPKRSELLQAMAALRQNQAEPVGIAEKWRKIGAEKVLNCMQNLILDMMRLKAAGDAPWLDNPDLRDNVDSLQRSMDLLQLQQVHDHLEKLVGWVSQNVNDELVMEDAMISWSRA